jgi:predicted TPR repeat methyltransferase
MKLGRPEGALSDADGAVAANPGWVKGHHRRAVALLALGRPLDAALAYEAFLAIEPENAFCKTKLRSLRAKNIHA